MRQELEELLERWPLGSELELTSKSLVYVVGAYKGITAELINELYHPELIRCYEPQAWAFKVLMEVVMANSNMEAFNYGLGNRAAQLPMGEFNTDACSFINVGPGSREQGEGMIVPAEWAMDGIEGHVDLMVINIEGGEFELIPYLRRVNLLPRIEGLAIQWHMDLREDLTKEVMDAEIDKLVIEDGYTLRRDDRPAWTYMTRWH